MSFLIYSADAPRNFFRTKCRTAGEIFFVRPLSSFSFSLAPLTDFLRTLLVALLLPRTRYLPLPLPPPSLVRLRPLLAPSSRAAALESRRGPRTEVCEGRAGCGGWTAVLCAEG
jgi:hypothetical protein